MNIDEYLNQLRTFKRKEERLYIKAERKESALTSPSSSANFGDRIQTRDRFGNQRDIMLAELADLISDYRTAHADYMNFREELRAHFYNMTYWQGAILLQVYINNVVFESDDDLRGVGDILNTTSRRVICSKLAEAKAALRERLRDQGVEIEDTNK